MRTSGLERWWQFRWFVAGRNKRLKRLRDPHTVLVESHCPRQVPRVLWTYWKQGEDAAPDLVKHCIASWRSLNAGWDIRVLDQASVPRFTAMTGVPGPIRIQHYTDVLRVRLLDEHGGVWTDATTLCATPLDHWLPPLMQSGFFAFSQPGPDRVIASWFLASEPGGNLIRAWRRANPEADGLWAGTPHVSADGPHLILRCLRQGYDPTRVAEGTALDAIPIHKLTWRENISIPDIQRILRHGRPTAPPRPE